MSADADGYFLTWKGQRTGPFSLAQVRAQLAEGAISRMHQINVDGRWQLLDEFLTEIDGAAAAQQATELQRQEAQLRQQFEAQLAAERARIVPPAPPPPPLPVEIKSEFPLSHLLPRTPPAPPSGVGYFPSPAPTFSPAPIFDEPVGGATRTSGLAIAALVMSLCNFIPYVNFFAWILVLVFGHTALSQMKRDPGLDGRGMAIAGLVITYFLLLVGLTFVVLLIVNRQKLPNLFSP